MSLERLQIPYLSTAERVAIIPNDRDLIYDTDLKSVFIGDGTTLGGNPLVAGGISEFTELTDVPSSYTGQGGKIVAVKADVSGLEFIAAGSGTGDVVGPATNTDSYIPQWDGANSKTLKNGIPTSTFAPALGPDDNYVTDAEKTVIGNTSGTNTGDQDLSGLIPKTQNTLTKEPTGFTSPADVIVTYDSTARTVTLTGTVEAYFRGTVVSALVSGWVSDAHTATTGPWFLYYNGSAFVWSQTAWTWDMLMIAFVKYGTTDKFAIRETHGLMQWQAHEEFHETIGTYASAGGDMS